MDYPAFRKTIKNSIIAYIHANTQSCTNNILALIDMQAEYINAKHDEFIENQFAIVQLLFNMFLFSFRSNNNKNNYSFLI